MQAGNFGFEPTLSSHHFQVMLPRSKSDHVSVTECFSWESGSELPARSEPPDGYLRVVIPATKWHAIADEVRAEFNRRLQREGQTVSRWTAGLNLVRRDLGKELVLLVWAIEDADPGLITTAVANWIGLVPEERWWLYTQAAAATGDAYAGRGRGWRKAIRFALTENPVSLISTTKPSWMRQVDRAARSQAALFSEAHEHDTGKKA